MTPGAELGPRDVNRHPVTHPDRAITDQLAQSVVLHLGRRLTTIEDVLAELLDELPTERAAVLRERLRAARNT